MEPLFNSLAAQLEAEQVHHDMIIDWSCTPVTGVLNAPTYYIFF